MKKIINLFLVAILNLASAVSAHPDLSVYAGDLCDSIHVQRIDENENNFNIQVKELSIKANGYRAHSYCNLNIPIFVPSGFYLQITNFSMSKDVILTAQPDHSVSWTTRRALYTGETFIIGEMNRNSVTQSKNYRIENASMGRFKFKCGEQPSIQLKISETLIGHGELNLKALNNFSDTQLRTEVLPCEK
jgi:hypothetical protein